MKKGLIICLAAALLFPLLTIGQIISKLPLQLITSGYAVNFGESILDQSTAKEVKVDIALVDFSALAKAKTTADSLSIIEKTYQDASKFSIVTGVLNYVTNSIAKVKTDARFRFSITDPKY